TRPARPRWRARVRVTVARWRRVSKCSSVRSSLPMATTSLLTPANSGAALKRTASGVRRPGRRSHPWTSGCWQRWNRACRTVPALRWAWIACCWRCWAASTWTRRWLFPSNAPECGHRRGVACLRLPCCDHRLASTVLGPIQLGVGGAQQARRVVAIGRVAGYADRHRHGRQAATVVLDHHRFHRDADFFGARRATVWRHFRQDQGEFLAAVAAGDVFVARVRGQHLCEMDEDRVAAVVAVLVVEALEVVDVQHQQRQRPAATLTARQFALQGFLQIAPVEQAGEGIADAL